MAQIEMIINSVRRTSTTDEGAIILKEKAAERYLPIYAGSPQASLLAKQLQGVGDSKLEDYVFSLTGIDTTKSKVESVIINRFDSNIFSARLLLSQHDKPLEVGCPPAIALALGVRAQAPYCCWLGVWSRLWQALKSKSSPLPKVLNIYNLPRSPQ